MSNRLRLVESKWSIGTVRRVSYPVINLAYLLLVVPARWRYRPEPHSCSCEGQHPALITTTSKRELELWDRHSESPRAWCVPLVKCKDAMEPFHTHAKLSRYEKRHKPLQRKSHASASGDAFSRADLAEPLSQATNRGSNGTSRVSPVALSDSYDGQRSHAQTSQQHLD